MDAAERSAWMAKAEQHLAARREFLQANLLGQLCDFGADEVHQALQLAVAEYTAWVKEHPKPRDGFLKLKVLLEMEKERSANRGQP